MGDPDNQEFKLFSTSSISDIISEVESVPTAIESMIHNESIFSALTSSALLTGYDYFNGNTLIGQNFYSHLTVSSAVALLSGTINSMFKWKGSTENALGRGGSAFLIRALMELLQYGINLNPAIEWLDLLTISLLTGASFAIGSYLFDYLKLTPVEQK